MSHSDSKVKWCINKAKKELGGGRKHRGLVELSPDINKAEEHLRKAEHNFKAIKYFDLGGFSDWSISAAFYSIYHCFLAILAKFGYESRNQECTLAAIRFLKEQKNIVLDDKFIEALQSQEEMKEKHEHTVIELREDYQYGIKKEIADKKRLEKLLQICSEAIYDTKKIIYGK